MNGILFVKTYNTSISNVHNPSEKYLLDLISKGENQYTDFKFEISDSRKIARSISAFANSGGGRLLVGVKDNGKIAGIRSEEEYYMIQGASLLYLKPKMQPEYKIWNIGGLTVLEVIVEKSKTQIYYAQDESHAWKLYIRINDQNHVAPPLLEKIWKKKNKRGILLKYSLAESNLLHYLEENSFICREQFKKIAVISDREADEILSDLVILKALDYRMKDHDLVFMLNPGFKREDYFLR